MHHTPWTSDLLRVRPARKPSPQRNHTPPAAPHSPAARRLAALLAALHATAPAPARTQPGCFCQARRHPLSRYTPLCKHCGLVLCALQRPHEPCPHCAAPLLGPAAREALRAQLQDELAAALARDERDRQRALDDARAAAGAFPSLGGGGVPDAGGRRGAEQAHRVLSLDAKTKKVKVASYGARTPPSRAATPLARGADDADADEGAVRVPPPPHEVPHAKGPRETWQRWADLRGAPVAYVEPPRAGAAARGKGARRRGAGGS